MTGTTATEAVALLARAVDALRIPTLDPRAQPTADLLAAVADALGDEVADLTRLGFDMPPLTVTERAAVALARTVLGAPGPVHNHGTEDGPGLACRETRTPTGLRGACMDAAAGERTAP